MKIEKMKIKGGIEMKDFTELCYNKKGLLRIYKKKDMLKGKQSFTLLDAILATDDDFFVDGKLRYVMFFTG